MKITYFINQYPKVSHTFIRREIRALEAQGFEIQRIALRGWDEVFPDPADRTEQARTLYVLRAGIWGLVLPSIATLASHPIRFIRNLSLALRLSVRTDHRPFHHLVWALEACRLRGWVRRHGSTHVHAHFGTNSAEVVMYLRRLGGPEYSFTVHGPEEFKAPIGLEEKIKHARFVVAISSFGRSQLYLRCEAPYWPRIKVVPCGLDRDFYESFASSLTFSRTLVCVGRLCSAKGQTLLLKAMAQVLARGIDFQLVLAGDGPMRPALEASVVELGLERHVRITGWIGSAAVRDEILAARALVLPSFAEGLPVVIMEAMALCRPVITTYVAGIPELVRSGEHGWLIPAGSVNALAAAMIDCLIQSPEALQEMGRACRSQVLERHRIEDAAERLGRLLFISNSDPSLTHAASTSGD